MVGLEAITVEVRPDTKVIQLHADPAATLGTAYRQEYSRGQAEARARVFAAFGPATPSAAPTAKRPRRRPTVAQGTLSLLAPEP